MKSFRRKGWCCSGFRFRAEEVGKRGLAIQVREGASGQPRFVLQSRAVDHGNEPFVDAGRPLTLVSESEFRYCPWCGKESARWYAKTWRELIKPEIIGIEIEGLD